MVGMYISIAKVKNCLETAKHTYTKPEIQVIITRQLQYDPLRSLLAYFQGTEVSMLKTHHIHEVTVALSSEIAMIKT